MSPGEELARGIAQLGLELPAGAEPQLLAYLELLAKWNRVYNLTAVRDQGQMVSHHLLDSLAVLPHLSPGHWLDVGCGGGLPGLVLAIARPDWRFTLVDSNSKKTSFVQQAIIELGLKNASVLAVRVEEWHPAQKFDGIISRAFAELADFVGLTRHLLSSKGRWVAMKGQPEAELKVLPKDVQIERVVTLKVPGLEAARSLVIVKAE